MHVSKTLSGPSQLRFESVYSDPFHSNRLLFSLCALPSVAQQGNGRPSPRPATQLDLFNAVKASALSRSCHLRTDAMTSSMPATTWLTRTWVTVSSAAMSKCTASHRPDRPPHCISAPKLALCDSYSQERRRQVVFGHQDGQNEILQRRVGTNENDAIQILDGLVDAQRDYASELRNGDTTKHYASRFLSDEGSTTGCIGNERRRRPSPGSVDGFWDSRRL